MARALGFFFVFGQGVWFEHFPAQGRGALGLFLRLSGQLPQLLFLFGCQLVGLGTEELLFQLGDISSRFSQQLLLGG